MKEQKRIEAYIGELGRYPASKFKAEILSEDKYTLARIIQTDELYNLPKEKIFDLFNAIVERDEWVLKYILLTRIQIESLANEFKEIIKKSIEDKDEVIRHKALSLLLNKKVFKIKHII